MKEFGIMGDDTPVYLYNTMASPPKGTEHRYKPAGDGYVLGLSSGLLFSPHAQAALWDAPVIQVLMDSKGRFYRRRAP